MNLIKKKLKFTKEKPSCPRSLIGHEFTRWEILLGREVAHYDRTYACPTAPQLERFHPFSIVEYCENSYIVVHHSYELVASNNPEMDGKK